MENLTVIDGVGHVLSAAAGDGLRLLQGSLTRRQLEARNEKRRADLLAYTNEWWDQADELLSKIWELRRLTLPRMAGQAPRSYQASRTPAPLAHRVALELGCGTAEARRILHGYHIDSEERSAVYLDEQPDVTTLGPFYTFARHLNLSEGSPYTVPAIPWLDADPTWPEPPPNFFSPTHGLPQKCNALQSDLHLTLDRFKRNLVKGSGTVTSSTAPQSKATSSTTEPTRAPTSTSNASTQKYQRKHEINAYQRANPQNWTDEQTWAALSEIRASPSHGERLDSRIAIRLNLQCFRAWNLCYRFDVDRAEREQVAPTATLSVTADCLTPIDCILAQRCRHPSYETGEAIEGCLRLISAHPGRF